MKISIPATKNPLHLTYCMNIHSGEEWPAVLAAVRTYACAVRDRLQLQGEFGLGLRLSAKAATTLEQGHKLNEFKKVLRENRLYVFTINGFPYGQFHGVPVKENVYAPDWSTSDRLEYTKSLVRILTELLPANVPGSISTLPGTYGREISPAKYNAILKNLLDAACYCHDIAIAKQRDCCLAIEPEPGCLWETTDDLIRLFTEDLPNYATKAGSNPLAQTADRLGVCLDTCHMAVLYEDIPGAVARLQKHEIPIAKVQLSAGLICRNQAGALRQLESFDEPVYLHQCAVKTSAGILRYPDLEAALKAARGLDQWDEVRTHFHVPLFVDHYGQLYSTGKLLSPEFFDLMRSGICRNLEVETYSFSVLPERYRADAVTENITKELEWVCQKLSRSG